VVLKSTSHAVYESKYHLVWCPKYRKKILVGSIRDRVKELFYNIAEEFDFEIDSCEVCSHTFVFSSKILDLKGSGDNKEYFIEQNI
jgi:putative transposase